MRVISSYGATTDMSGVPAGVSPLACIWRRTVFLIALAKMIQALELQSPTNDDGIQAISELRREAFEERRIVISGCINGGKHESEVEM